MKGKIPLFLRLTLVVILAVSFSLVPMAVNPQPALAAPSLTTGGATPQMSTVKATTAQVNAGLPLRLAATGFTASGAGTITVSAGGVYDIDTSYNNLGTGAAISAGTNTAATGTATVTAGGTLSGGSNTVTITTSATSQTVTVTLATGNVGIAVSGTATVTGSPAALAAGANTVTISNNPGAAATLTVIVGRTAVTADANGNIVVGGTYYNPTTTAATVTITVTNTTDASTATTTLAIATAVTQQVKITVGSLVAYADPSTAPLPNIPTFAKVGDAVTVEAQNQDFTAGGPISISFDGTSQTVLGNTTVDALPMSGGAANTNYRKFTSTILIPAVTGSSVVTSAGGAPLSGKTTRVSDGVSTIIFAVGVTPKARFSPNLGGKGATITVAGSGFAKSKSITLYSSAGAITATTLATAATAVSTGSIVTDATGSFSGTFASLANTSRISAVDGDGNMVLNMVRLDETGGTFSSKPSISVSPTTGKPGDTITLRGSEWTASTAFKVFFGVEAVDYTATGLTATATGTTDSSGQILTTTFAIPSTTPTGAALVPGTYKVYVVESGNRDQSTSITVSALPMTLAPTSSPRYGKVTISVSGLTGGGTIPVNLMTLAGTAWNSVANAGLFITGINTTTGVISLDGAGAATFTLRVPSTSTIGNNEVSITDSAGRVALGRLTVATPTITLSPTEAARNSTVLVTGKGWASEQTVTVSATVTGKTTATASAVPAADGSFSSTFSVPTGWAADDNATVSANDGTTIGNTSASAILHVPVASIKVSPTTAKWGATITVTGSGFKGGTTIRALIPWDTASTANSFPTAVYTDTAGNFTGTFILPSVEKGVQSIGATDGTVSATGTVNVEEAPATVASALATISTQLVRVWAFDAASQTWQLYDPSAPAALSTLAALNKGQGYFINVKAATTIVTGSGNSVSLSPGWNLVGW